jgi:hypothetical protein
MRAPLVPLLTALCLAALLSSCGQGGRSVAVAREQLFTLSYGLGEDQLDLSENDAAQATLKTCVTMREGIFYISNGNSAKIVRYSSFGDVLSMLYNPEKTPEPLLLKQNADKNGAAERRAVQYPFRSVGELAVDSRQNLYVEDRLPPERRVVDKETNSVLDYAVLRFDKDGQFLDYLGQEGVGGTPFPYIMGVYVTANDDCVVVSVSQSSWLISWFDSKGLVRHSLKLRRNALPEPPNGKNYISSLDKIVPNSDGRTLIVKIDYYRPLVDASTKSDTGVDFAGSWAYKIDPTTGAPIERWEIPSVEKTVKDGNSEGPKRYVKIPEFLGVSGQRFFFISADEGSKNDLSIYDTVTHAVSHYSIDIAPDELYFNTLYLSSDGILCALLGTKYEARLVWWRFDKLLGAVTRGASSSEGS